MPLAQAIGFAVVVLGSIALGAKIIHDSCQPQQEFARPQSKERKRNWSPERSNHSKSRKVFNTTTHPTQAGSLPHYRMRSNPKGIGVIINNESFETLPNRTGTEADGKNLTELYNFLGFFTNGYHFKNKTKAEMRRILIGIAEMDHTNMDCLMVAILTHGGNGDMLYGSCGRGLCANDLYDIFSGENCSSLVGKPKVFVIQACRGSYYNKAVNYKGDHEADLVEDTTDMDNSCKLPNKTDF